MRLKTKKAKGRSTSRNRRKSQPLALRLPANVITREQLALLRDEIETVLVDARQQIEQSHKRENHLYNAYQNNNRLIEEMQIAVRDMQQILGLDQRCSPYSIALGEHVAVSYFHSWIARINERLERLEQSAHEKASVNKKAIVAHSKN